MSQLTKEQVQCLVTVLLDEFGSNLTDDELTDQVSLLLEDIAGFETVSDLGSHHVINQVRNQYHDSRNQNH